MYTLDGKIQVPSKNITFVISQFHAEDRAQQEFNKDFAKALAWHIHGRGDFPVLPHLYFPRFLGDEGQEREWGIEAGHCMMTLCNRTVVAVIDEHLSEGMEKDICFSVSLGILPETMKFTETSARELIRRFKESRA